MTLATNRVTSGIIVQMDGANAPSNCDLGNLRIEEPASYGLNIVGGLMFRIAESAVLSLRR